MAQSRDLQQLGPLADKVLAFVGELADGADGLSARDDKRLAELTRKARTGKGLTTAERMQVLRLAYRAVPQDRLDDVQRFLKQRRTGRAGKGVRPRLKP